MNRSVRGTAAALASMAALVGVMLPVRSHLSIATAALVLVVPVVVGVVVGGFVAGALSVVAGFLVYDFLFIPPFGTLSVGVAQNWVALGVYAVVMLLVARVVAGMNAARAQARRQGSEIRELFGLSELLVADKPLDALLAVIVTTLIEAFESRQVALLLPRNGQLEVVSSGGEALTEGQLRRVLPGPGELSSLASRSVDRDDLLVLALTAAGRPVGLLVLSADTARRHQREPLLMFANHVALAVERAQLREQVLRTRLTEEVARLARTLVAAVAHDLRTPLASIKASSSTLADPDLELGPQAALRLAKLIDAQADRLAELVTNLLDMSRIQAGVLQPRRALRPLADLVATVVAELDRGGPGHAVQVDIPEDLPPVDVDVVLVSRVLTNLLENAVRHSPQGAPISVRAASRGLGAVEVSVSDLGPGVGPERRSEVFELFARRPGDTGAGLGLTIAKTFVEAHGQHIWVDSGPTGGATFHFTLPLAAAIPEEPGLVADPRH